MALLRVVCLSSANQLSAQTASHSISLPSLSQSINFPNYSSFRLPRLSLTTTKQTPNFTLTCVSTSQQQPQPVTEEEFSRTRLLAQNVPWTSTPEDIRSLFEKHGKVLEVEVCFFFPPLFYGSVYLRFLFPEIVTVVAVKLSMYKKDRNRGLAFVEMGSPEEALEALNKLESYVSLKHSTLLLLFTNTRTHFYQK